MANRPDGTSRRRLLGASLTGAAALALSACGAHKNHPVKAGSVPDQDLVLLHDLLELEYKTIAAYEAGIPLLKPQTAKGPEQFLRHELSHAGELVGLIKKASGQIPKPQGDYNLGHPRGSDDLLALFLSLETQQLSAYLRTIPLLSDGGIRAGLAAVFANDAQHVALLRAQLHEAAAPAAFVTGRQ